MKLELEDIRRVDIKPGEVLAVTLPPHAEPHDSTRLREALQELLPGVKILVVSAGVDLQVFNPEAIAEATAEQAPHPTQ